MGQYKMFDRKVRNKLQEQEAIEVIKRVYNVSCLVREDEMLYEKAIELAIKALEKQIAKEVKFEPWMNTECDCGFVFSVHHGDGYHSIPYENQTKYCPNCGQKLDWGEEEFIEKLIGKLEETDFNDIQMVVREVLLKYGFPYESVVQDEVWNALDELSTNKVAIKIVNQLAEEYNNGWVPCSERLPEKKGDYLVTCNDGKVRVWWFVVADDFKCWLEGVGNLKPIAWMPLPEPYKESEE